MALFYIILWKVIWYLKQKVACRFVLDVQFQPQNHVLILSCDFSQITEVVGPLCQIKLALPMACNSFFFFFFGLMVWEWISSMDVKASRDLPFAVWVQLLWALWHPRVLRIQQHVLFTSACNEPVIWLCIAGGDCGNNSGAIFMRHCAERGMSENLCLNACWQHISVYRNMVDWGERHRMALLVVVVATCRCSLARSLAGC